MKKTGIRILVPVLALCLLFLAGCGGAKDTPSMYRHIALLCGQDGFSYGPDPAKNSLLFTVSDYYHTDYLVPYYLWNYLKILFRL